MNNEIDLHNIVIMEDFIKTLSREELDRLYTLEIVDSYGEKLICYDYVTTDDVDNKEDSKLYFRYIELPEINSFFEIPGLKGTFVVKLIMTDKEKKIIRILVYDMVEAVTNKRKDLNDED